MINTLKHFVVVVVVIQGRRYNNKIKIERLANKISLQFSNGITSDGKNDDDDGTRFHTCIQKKRENKLTPKIWFSTARHRTNCAIFIIYLCVYNCILHFVHLFGLGGNKTVSPSIRFRSNNLSNFVVVFLIFF